MATIKMCTDIPQSKVLAEFLPLESVDMYYPNRIDIKYQGALPIEYKNGNPLLSQEIAAWSLDALLGVLPKKYYPIKDHETNLILGKPKDKWCALYWDATGMQDGEQTLADNPVDACVAMIELLHEQKLL